MKANLVDIWNLNSDYRIEPVPEKLNSVWAVFDRSGHFFLKSKSSQERALDEIHLLDHLASCGLPVSVPIPDRAGNRVSCIDGAFFCLYPRVQGKVIKGNLEIMKYGTSFGSSFGLLHKASAQYVHLDKLSRMNISSQLEDWILVEIKKNMKEFSHPKLIDTIASIQDGIKKLDDLPFQPIHRDPHAEHFFFSKNELTGIIDFELSIVGPRIFDPCYLSTSIITDYSGNSVDTEGWLLFLSHLIAGYHSAHPLNDNEFHSVEYMLYMIELIFIAFWCSTGKFDNARTTENSLYFLTENKEAIRNAILTIEFRNQPSPVLGLSQVGAN